MSLNEFLTNRKKDDEVLECIKREADYYRNMYTLMCLENEAWKHGLHQLVSCGRISKEASNLMYDMVSSEMDIVANELFK